MCRYGFSVYKPHYACFKCRKTFKRRISSDFSELKNPPAKLAKCPDCGELMADMGLDFEAPGRGRIKAWEHLRLLYSVGIAFHSCGCSGPGYIPNTREALAAHLEGLISIYNGELDQVRRDAGKQSEEARSYWIGKIKVVEQRLSALSMHV